VRCCLGAAVVLADNLLLRRVAHRIGADWAFFFNTPVWPCRNRTTTVGSLGRTFIFENTVFNAVSALVLLHEQRGGRTPAGFRAFNFIGSICPSGATSPCGIHDYGMS